MRPCAVSQPIVERATVESGGGGGGGDDDDPPIADDRDALASVLRGTGALWPADRKP